MYTVMKEIEISAAHKLNLDYESRCRELHGHNWKIRVWLRSETLDKNGMIMDFTHIKKAVVDALDHKYVNDVVDFNPTAENLASFICSLVGPLCFKVEIWEQEGSYCCYEIQ